MKIPTFSIVGLILIVIVLSGCTEVINNSDVEILEYTVSTNWESGSKPWNITKNFQPGFYHDIPEDVISESQYYLINGTIKNIAGHILNQISISAVFYDSQGTELFSTEPIQYIKPVYSNANIFDLPNGYSKTFQIKINKSLGFGSSICEYFDNVEDFKFIITVY